MAKITKYFYHKMKATVGQVTSETTQGTEDDFIKSSSYGKQYLALIKKGNNTFIPQFKYIIPVACIRHFVLAPDDLYYQVVFLRSGFDHSRA